MGEGGIVKEVAKEIVLIICRITKSERVLIATVKICYILLLNLVMRG